MSNNFFPDGFPTTPIEAINLSANLGFLTPDEQQGWFKWMETSTPSQQQELVETLHLIFIDHQKQSPTVQNFGQNQPNQNNFQNNQQSNQLQQNSQQNGQNQPNFGQNWQNNPANNSTNNFNQNNQETFQNNPQSNQFNSQNSQFGRDDSNFGQDSMKNEQQNWQNNPQNFENSNQRQNSNQDNFLSANSTSQNSGQNQPNFGQNPGQNSGQNNSNNFNSNNSNNGGNPFGLNHNDFEKQQNEYQKELDSFENKNSQNSFDNPNSGQSSPSRPATKTNQTNSDFEFDENIENKNNNSDNPYSNNPSEESFLNLANSKYTPNPILDNNEPTPKEFIYQNEPQKLEEPEKIIKITEKTTEKTEPKTDTKILVKEKIVEKIVQEPEPVVEFANENDEFSFEDESDDQNENKDNENIDKNNNSDNYQQSVNSNLISPPNDINTEQNTKIQGKNNTKPFYSAPERTQLEEVYNQFVTSQKKKMDDQQEFSSHKLILDEDAWSKQSEFFGKVMEVMSNYEQMTDSLLKLNAQNIELARKIKVLENATQIRPSSSSVQRVLDGLSIDIKNLSRDFDDFRTDIYSQQRDISEQVAAATADTFKSDGIKQQIDLLANRITRMETQR
jgi:hypothetical protein